MFSPKPNYCTDWAILAFTNSISDMKTEYGFDDATFMTSFPHLGEDTENNSPCDSVAKVTIGGPRGSDYDFLDLKPCSLVET